MKTISLFQSLAGVTLAACVGQAHAQNMTVGGKLLLTGGVNSIEGAAGGGITPWAVIAGYGTRDQFGGNAFVTNVRVDDYQLRVAGLAVGIYDRVELSFAKQRFDTRDVGATLGLGRGFTFTQKIVGAKVKMFGDAVLEQDSWIPQVSLGVMRKDNDRGDLLRSLGIRNGKGTDVYVSATKLFLDPGVLVNGTLRATKANQTGLLGFGTVTKNKVKPQFEGSIAYLLRRDLAIGAEIRTKPNRLAFKEDRWTDLFVAWTPTKNVSLTLAYVDLGNLVIKDRQRGSYLSLQIGF